MSPDPEPRASEPGAPRADDDAAVTVAGSESHRPTIVVAARDEADRIAATLAALRRTWPGSKIVVADDGSRDQTAKIAAADGAYVVTGPNVGKGGNVTRALADERVVGGPGAIAGDDLFLLCDADLGETAARLRPLIEAVAARRCALAVAEFQRRRGGGFGVAIGYAHDAIERLCGFDARAPISGQRALNGAALRAALPFAPAYGIELAMTVDVVNAGLTVLEIPVDLEHRATGRTPAGFLHRARQLRDFRRAVRERERRKSQDRRRR